MTHVHVHVMAARQKWDLYLFLWIHLLYFPLDLINKSNARFKEAIFGTDVWLTSQELSDLRRAVPSSLFLMLTGLMTVKRTEEENLLLVYNSSFWTGNNYPGFPGVLSGILVCSHLQLALHSFICSFLSFCRGMAIKNRKIAIMGFRSVGENTLSKKESPLSVYGRVVCRKIFSGRSVRWESICRLVRPDDREQ